MGAVTPHAPDNLPTLQFGDIGAQPFDLTYLGVTPVSDRIVKSRIPREEEPSLGIPLLLEIGIRAPASGSGIGNSRTLTTRGPVSSTR